MVRAQKEKFTGIGSLIWLRILFCGITLLITIIILISLSLPTNVDVGIRNDSNYKDVSTKLPKFEESQLHNHGGNHSNTKRPLNSSNKLVLDTPTCKIGQGNLWPPEFKNNWNWSSGKNRVPNCDHEQKLFSYVKADEVIEVLYPNFKECSVREIVSTPGAPNNNVFSEINRINLTTSQSRLVNVSHMEMFIVICNKFVNFEANLPTKPHVEKKTLFWSKKSKKDGKKTRQIKPKPSKVIENAERPINVLWLGIDTTSNIHFHRSFPKTLKVLNEMNFMEFSGYHSIMFMTQPNFLAFLMGSTYRMTQENECNTNVSTTWDTCPFIWKEFQKRNYVTMFLEDFEGTLNRNGSLGGFKRAPTDYYLQPLFLSHKEYRKNVTETDKDCMSTETVPQFLLRYNERFLQKFNSTPFFSFTWFNYPFHSFDFALPNVDADFEKFYRKLQRDPKLLENTLIILNADHGQRYGIYKRNSIEGFLERSLPPLFIRIPKKLLQQYPNLHLKEFAETNRNRLTTPFDIHHTLLHVLSLGDKLRDSPILPAKNQSPSNSKNNGSQHHTEEFERGLADRSSLFSLISDDRTCDKVHIDETMCVCNTHLASQHLTNPFEVSRMIDYGMKQINSVIKGSKFEHLCKPWEGTWLPLSSADVIHKTGNSMVVLLKWDTVPVAQFETQLRITLANSSETFNRIETVTEPVRISSYGNSTWCIPGQTNSDRHIKEFCYCKEDAPVLIDHSLEGGKMAQLIN